MKIASITYTYPDDYAVAERGDRVLRKNWSRTKECEPVACYWCVHRDHAEAARRYVSEESEYFRAHEQERPIILEHNFDAGGHLNGSNAVFGMRWQLWELFFRNPQGMRLDAVIKKDSDCMILKPECFTEPVRLLGSDHVYAPQNPFKPKRREDDEEETWLHIAWGPAYLLSRRAAGHISKVGGWDLKKLTRRCYGHEDIIFSRIVQRERSLKIAEFPGWFIIGNATRRNPDDKTVYVCDNPRKQSRQVYGTDGNKL